MSMISTEIGDEDLSQPSRHRIEVDEEDFDTWISARCKALNTDEAVFGPYIKSIVEGDESVEEKVDALDGILGELAEGSDEKLDVEEFRKEILTRWDQQTKRQTSSPNSIGNSTTTDLDSKLENILRINDDLIGTNKSNSLTRTPALGCENGTQAPDPSLRAAILNQYKGDSDDDSDGEKAPVAAGSSGLERNTNAERIQHEMKDKREKEKADAAKKREKDKEDRAKQKQQTQERKDKAKKKAAKVERKR